MPTEKPDAPGIAFEKAVASIQQRMDPNSTVLHNVKLVDRLGHRRQFDVVIKGKIGGYEALGVIECKDLNKRVGTPEVDAFVTKARDVGANLTLLASKRGFTGPAIEKAKDYGIGTISLLNDGLKECGFYLGVQWYAERYAWTKLKVILHFSAKKRPIDSFDAESVTYRGMPILFWIRKELVTVRLKEEKLGWHQLELQFDRPRLLSNGEKQFKVKAITFQALRESVKKTKMFRISGDGIYNFSKEQISIPPEGVVEFGTVRTDFSDWADYAGDIPEPSQFLDLRLRVYETNFDPETPVFDVTKL